MYLPNLQFYQTLPDTKLFRDIYIPGYTEVLNLVDSVRVVPNLGFVEDLSSDYVRMFKMAGFPSYYIPIKEGKAHYGFILKGLQKPTPHFSLWLNAFNISAIWSPEPYLFVVEGIKDSYLWMYYKYPIIAMLTSDMSEILYREIAKSKKVMVVMPDNDDTGRRKSLGIAQKALKWGIKCRIYLPRMHKDFGDWFDRIELRKELEREFDEVVDIAKNLAAEAKT